MRLVPVIIFAGMIWAAQASAEAVRNGNEFCLNYVRADAAGKRALRQNYENKLLTFRFLKVVGITSNAVPGGLPVYRTIEPSSDFTVILHAQGPVSRQVTADVATNDCLVANGRLAPLGNAVNTLVIDPAVLRSKDRAAPKGEKELLPEIDKTAVK
jgi:hypothetical protein